MEFCELKCKSNYKDQKQFHHLEFNMWKLLSHAQLFVTPWTIQSMKFSRPEYWSGSFSLLQVSSQPRDWTHVSSIEGRFFTSWATREVPEFNMQWYNILWASLEHD